MARYYNDDQYDALRQQQFFNTLSSVGAKDPYYALGLALGRGVSNAIANSIDNRQTEKLMNYANTPSAQIALRDAAMKEAINPDIKKLANSVYGGGTDSVFGNPIQVPIQSGYNGKTLGDIQSWAAQNGISNRILNRNTPLLQENIKKSANDYFVPRIANMAENVNSADDISNLMRELNLYRQYDPDGAKQMLSYANSFNKNSGIAKLSNAVGKPSNDYKIENDRYKAALADIKELGDKDYETMSQNDKDRFDIAQKIIENHNNAEKVRLGIGNRIQPPDTVTINPQPQKEQTLWERIFGSDDNSPQQPESISTKRQIEQTPQQTAKPQQTASTQPVSQSKSTGLFKPQNNDYDLRGEINNAVVGALNNGRDIKDVAQVIAKKYGTGSNEYKLFLDMYGGDL